MKEFRSKMFVLIWGMVFLFSCKDKDNYDYDWKADLPKLSIDSVSMSGVIGIHDAVMFSINDVPFIGLGYMPFVGESNYFYYYSSQKQEWIKIAEYPGGVREGVVAFVIGNKAYVGLGASLLGNIETGYSRILHDDFFVYDSESGIWDTQPIKFPGTPRSSAVAFSISGKGYVGAGCGKSLSDCFPDFYEFDPEEGWIQVTRLAKARARAHAFVANGYGYVCFGDGADDIQKFDPKSGTWKSQPICYDKDETEELHPFLLGSFVINKNGEDFVYLWGDGCWGYNPLKNLWKKVDYPLYGEYGFTIGGRGFSMSMKREGGFEARIFEVIK